MSETPATKALTQLHHKPYDWKDCQRVKEMAACAQRRWFQRVPMAVWQGCCWGAALWAAGALLGAAWIALLVALLVAAGARFGWAAHGTPVDPVLPELDAIGLEQLRVVDAWADDFVLVRSRVAAWMMHGRSLQRRDFEVLEKYVHQEHEAWRRHRAMQAMARGPAAVERIADTP